MAEEEVNEELFHRSMSLQRQLAQMGMRYEKLHGGVRGQNRTLALLSKNEGMKQAELARFARVRPSSISEVVDRLERHGLSERRRDNSDHWVFRLYLTEKGKLDPEGDGRSEAGKNQFRDCPPPVNHPGCRQDHRDQPRPNRRKRQPPKSLGQGRLLR